jgi:hypothetical protein
MASRDHDNQDELSLFLSRVGPPTLARWQKNQDGRWSLAREPA